MKKARVFVRKSAKIFEVFMCDELEVELNKEADLEFIGTNKDRCLGKGVRAEY